MRWKKPQQRRKHRLPKKQRLQRKALKRKHPYGALRVVLAGLDAWSKKPKLQRHRWQNLHPRMYDRQWVIASKSLKWRGFCAIFILADDLNTGLVERGKRSHMF